MINNVRAGTLLFVATVLVASTTFVEAGWIDPDSPFHAHTTRAHHHHHPNKFNNGAYYRLVFSDEFAQEGRTFADGADPRWTALDKNDITNNPLHYYSQDNARTTADGKLNITLDMESRTFVRYDQPNKKTWNETKEFRSAQLQSWNKFCFTGGILEMAAQLPGNPYTGGLWPALWSMGNLGRATYVNATERMWPFSTGHVCDDRNRYSQEINACRGKQDAPGRGAPELDLLEVMYIAQINASMMSASLQVAPGLATGRPELGKQPKKTWYQPTLGNGVSLNEYFYGVHVTHETNDDDEPNYEYQTDTISVNYWLDDSFWTRQHVFRVEWEPPDMDDGTGGYIHWYVDGNFMAGIEGSELQRVSQTEIPSEPMSLLMNLAVSKDWSFPDAWFLDCEHKCWSCSDPDCQCALPHGFCESLPVHFLIDYVRVYQAPHNARHTVGCSPPARPTADFIQAHQERYTMEGQTEPLRPVAQGGASCTQSDQCGHGSCVANDSGTRRADDAATSICQCHDEWTGPSCLAHDGYNDTVVDARHVTVGLLSFVVLSLLVASVLSFLGYFMRSRQYSEGVLCQLLSDIESEKAMQTTIGTPEAGSSESFALIPKEQSGEHDSAPPSYQHE